MALRVPENVTGEKPALRGFINGVRSSLRQLLAIPFVNGQLLEFSGNRSAATAEVPHGLGRRPKGWILLGIKDAATGTTTPISFYEKIDNPSDDKALRLYQTGNPGANSIVSIWVF